MNKRHWTNFISDLFGGVARAEFPGPLQKAVNRLYALSMKVDMSEFNDPADYATLDALFTRKLIRERRFDHDVNTLISPADSLITGLGRLRGDILLQIKGMAYSVKELLTPNAGHIDEMLDGTYINFYLSPRDYHRYHAPAALRVKRLIHVPGRLHPVNRPSLLKRKNLFPRNERVILECVHETGGLLYLIFVGAAMVGSMTFEFEPRVRTNRDSPAIKVYDYEDQWILKGDCIGCFHMGSSIVMVARKNFLELRTGLNQKVKFGDTVARVAADWRG
ncbi:MAG: phosphatidylserine decarboxylase [Desulfobacterales bacterium]|nr:phosphatidylserine decarboxylase [Desulfobacterales bacterium]